MGDILDVITTRKSIRRYTTEPVPNDMILKVLEAGRWAPSGENYQPWRLIVVKDQKKKDTIARLSKIGTGSRATAWYSMGQMQERFEGIKDPEEKARVIRFMVSGEVSEFPSKAPVVIVVVGDLSESVDVPYDLSACLENMFLEAHSLGLGACWIHGPAGNIRHAIELKKLLGIPTGMGQYKVLAVMSVGWPLEQRRHPRPKKPLEEIVFWEEFGRKEPS